MVLLVDGSASLHRASKSVVGQEMSGDVPTGAIDTFLKSLAANCRKLYCREGVAVFWDLGVPLFRRALFRDYKPDKTPVTTGLADTRFLSSRNLQPYANTKDDPRQQEIYTKARAILHNNVLPYLGCLSVQVADCEADDLISYWTHVVRDGEATILTVDHDLIQLLRQDQVRVLFSKAGKETTFEEDGYVQDHDLDKHYWRTEFILRKALTGGEDGIPRIPGLTPKPIAHFAHEIAEALYRKYQGWVNEDTVTDVIRQDVTPPAKGQRLEENLDALRSDTGVDLVYRNYCLIDLSYPIRAKVPLLRDMANGILRAALVEQDDTRVEDYLDAINARQAKTHLPDIVESNTIDDPTSYAGLFK